MKRIKIFWCHPQLRDYRKPFFDLMHQGYEVRFLFQLKSDIKNHYQYIYAITKPNQKGLKRILHFSDIIKLYKGIKKADVFISSFLIRDLSQVGIIFAKLLNKKIIIWEEFSYFHRGLKAKLRYWQMRIFAKLINAFYVMGEPQKIALKKLGVNNHKIFMANEYPGNINNKIDCQEISELKYLENKNVILYFGRFLEIKGIKYLLEAFAELEDEKNDVFLLIVGYGPLEDKLKKISKKLNLRNIHFFKPVFEMEKKLYIFQKLANIVVVPSIISKSGDTEGGPLVVLEALSMGCPVIGTNVLGNTQQFIQNGLNGFVVHYADSNALNHALNKALILLNSSFNRGRIKETFKQIKDHHFQFEKMKKAIEYSVSN